jgi:hypothetical protein
MGYRVTSPYVTVKISAAPGAALTTLGFYQGAILPGNVDLESAELQVLKGMVERVSTPTPATAPTPAEEVPAGGETPVAPSESVAGPPAKNASKVAWVAFAVSQRGEGVDEAEARTQAEALTHAELVAKYGG